MESRGVMDFPDVFGDIAFGSTLAEPCGQGFDDMEYAMLLEDIDMFDPSAAFPTSMLPAIDANDVQIFQEIQQSLACGNLDLAQESGWPVVDSLSDLPVEAFDGWDQLLTDFESPESLSSVDSPTTSPQSTSGSDTTHHPYRCPTEGCTKTFRKESQLKQHQRVHCKALTCTICRHERQTEHMFAQVRDLERHIQARHKDVAAKANIRSEIRHCPFPGCSHQGRRDNVSRHHESRHGLKLKWKRGSPHVVS